MYYKNTCVVDIIPLKMDSRAKWDGAIPSDSFPEELQEEAGAYVDKLMKEMKDLVRKLIDAGIAIVTTFSKEAERCRF